jgi:asparagine synthase
LPLDDGKTLRAAAVLVQRLEDRVAELVAGQSRVALAYSGGLSSTVVAMVARKRCDLECVVAGSAESEDLRAARRARQYLDYRVTIEELNTGEMERILKRAKAENPRLSANALLTFLPLYAVHDRAPEKQWLSGFGPQRSDPLVVEALRRLQVHSPLVEALVGARISRSTIRLAATSLGLPEEWARVRHREPALGAGIAALLPSIEKHVD